MQPPNHHRQDAETMLAGATKMLSQITDSVQAGEPESARAEKFRTAELFAAIGQGHAMLAVGPVSAMIHESIQTRIG